MLAAFVNPRTTRLATVSQLDGKIRLHNRANFNTPDFDGFEAILSRYLRSQEGKGGVLCIAASGPVSDNVTSSTFLPWSIDGSELLKNLSFARVTILQEHIATARGIFELGPEKLFAINENARSSTGNIGIIAVDERLEEALMVFDGEHYVTYITNGGNTAFGPTTQLEVDLWQYLYSQRDGIEVEDVVSRDGLVAIYDYYLDSEGSEAPGWYYTGEDKASRIIELALSGRDRRAVDSVDLFVDCFAAEAGNLALRGVTTNGIYLGGRIISELLPSLDQGRFFDNFIRGGAVEAKLGATPIHVLMDRKTALLGAARCAIEMEETL